LLKKLSKDANSGSGKQHSVILNKLSDMAREDEKKVILTAFCTRNQNTAFCDALSNKLKLDVICLGEVRRNHSYSLAGIYDALCFLISEGMISLGQIYKYGKQYYIRNGHSGKVCLMDKVKVILLFFVYLSAVSFLFKKKKVLMVMVSHDPYLEPRLLEKYAIYKKIKVCFVRHWTDKATSFAIWNGLDKKPAFCELSDDPSEKDQPNDSQNSQLSDRAKNSNKVVVYAHEFFDAPALMGKICFDSYREWIEYTLSYLKKKQCVVYVKKHPVATDLKNKKVWNELKSKYENKACVFVDDHIPAVELSKDAMLNITFRSTVTFELFGLGVPIIHCAESPFSEKKVVHLALSVNEYKVLLEKGLNSELECHTPGGDDINSIKEAFVGGKKQKFGFSFEAHPSTEIVSNVIERVELEKKSEYYDL